MIPSISKNGMNYVIEGTGPWITLSHSLGCNISMWDPQIELLKGYFTVLRFDTRGHGKSKSPIGPYSLVELANDVYELFNELGIKSSHWIGLSMGGMIGQTLALTHPNLISSLVLADTTSKRPDNALKMWGERIEIARSQGMRALVQSTLDRWFTNEYRNAALDVMEKIGDDIQSTPVEGFIGCCEAIARVDTFDRLKEIICPTLIMVGESDHGTPPEMGLQIHQQIEHSRFYVIPNASHISNIEQSDIFNRHLMEFYIEEKIL